MPPHQPTAFDWHFQSPAQAPCCVTPSSNGSMRYRNFCLLSIAYACCLGLGPDLPWDDERCPGSLRLSVGQILTDRFATHTSILTSKRSSCPCGQPSTPLERSPTQWDIIYRISEAICLSMLSSASSSSVAIATAMTPSSSSHMPAYPAHLSLSYSVDYTHAATTSVLYLSPGYFRRRASRPVSYYALFEWWLLLSQHPGCL